MGGAEDFQKIIEAINFAKLTPALFVIGFAWLLARGLSSFLGRLGERLVDRRLIFQQISQVGRFLIYFIGVVVAVLMVVKGDRLILAAAPLGFAIAFASKDLAGSVIAGITIMIDRPFQVGDRISVGGQYGEVRAIGLRSVKMATLDDNLVTIPNNTFLTEMVASGNAGELHMLIQMDFYISSDQNVRKARDLVGEALTSSRYFNLNHPWTVLINQVIHDGHFAIRLRAKGYVIDVKFEKDFETDVTLRVLEAFKTHKILAPARLTRLVAS